MSLKFHPAGLARAEFAWTEAVLLCAGFTHRGSFQTIKKIRSYIISETDAGSPEALCADQLWDISFCSFQALHMADRLEANVLTRLLPQSASHAEVLCFARARLRE